MNPDLFTELELRDIHLASEPNFWPPALGGWLLLFLGVIGVGFSMRAAYRHYRNWQRRQHLQTVIQDYLQETLEQFAHDDNSAQLVAAWSALLKRIALMQYPDHGHTIAGLTGEKWLLFLDRTGGGEQFTKGVGRIFATAPYQPTVAIDVIALQRLIEQWIQRAIRHPLPFPTITSAQS